MQGYGLHAASAGESEEDMRDGYRGANTPIPPMKTAPAGSVIDDRPRRIQIALARYWGLPVEIPMDQLIRDIVYELDK
jgi:hypothetical protein